MQTSSTEDQRTQNAAVQGHKRCILAAQHSVQIPFLLIFALYGISKLDGTQSHRMKVHICSTDSILISSENTHTCT